MIKYTVPAAILLLVAACAPQLPCDQDFTYGCVNETQTIGEADAGFAAPVGADTPGTDGGQPATGNDSDHSSDSPSEGDQDAGGNTGDSGSESGPDTGSDTDGPTGNPGNDKGVGNAGENPNGKGGWGDGDKGKSDGDHDGKGKGK